MAISVVSWFLSEWQISAGEGSAPVLVTMVPFTCAFWVQSGLLALGMVSQGCHFGWLSFTDQHCEHLSSPGIAVPLLPVCV